MDRSKARLHTGVNEGGNHTVRIWRTSDSTVVAGPFTWNITSGTDGWKEYTLATPLNITANTDYIISISTSSDKYYVVSSHQFDNPINNGNLVTYTGSGKYTDSMGTMPNLVVNNNGYFRDVVFVAD